MLEGTRLIYITVDGKEFIDKNEAEKHELHFRLAKLLDDNGVGHGGTWDGQMFMEFLLDHHDELTSIFLGTQK